MTLKQEVKLQTPPGKVHYHRQIGSLACSTHQEAYFRTIPMPRPTEVYFAFSLMMAIHLALPPICRQR